MKTALALISSLALVACSAAPDQTSATTTSGGATTGGTGASATTSGGSQGTTGASSAGSTTTGGIVYTGECASNMYVCPQGSAKAGQYYPGASPANCGSSPGQTFANITLQGGGILNLSTSETEDSASNFSSTPISMLDLYCSGFNYVFVDVSAVWCPHCQTEASQIPGWTGSAYSSASLYQTWMNAGGTVLSLLVQSNNPADPATPTDLTTWVSTYHTPYPMSLDTGSDMPNYTGLTGWPENLILNLSNMQVVDAVSGDQPDFYQEYCGILHITNCPQ